MAFNRRLFREEAIARRGKTEPLNGLLRVTAPHEWVILVLLGIAVLGAVAWGIFGRIEQSVSARCVLAQPGDRYPVVASVSGNVVELLAEVGDTVEAGQPIARIMTPELSREVAVARTRVEILEERARNMADALDVARAELIELEALEAAGEFINTPRAGIITASVLSLGQMVKPGLAVATVRDGAARELEAFAMVLPEYAPRLAVGMKAQVLTATQFGKSPEALAAEVTHISLRPTVPPHWLTDLGIDAPERSYMVRIALQEAATSPIADGDPCGLRIVLRETSPVRVLLTAMSN